MRDAIAARATMLFASLSVAWVVATLALPGVPGADFWFAIIVTLGSIWPLIRGVGDRADSGAHLGSHTVSRTPVPRRERLAERSCSGHLHLSYRIDDRRCRPFFAQEKLV